MQLVRLVLVLQDRQGRPALPDQRVQVRPVQLERKVQLALPVHREVLARLDPLDRRVLMVLVVERGRAGRDQLDQQVQDQPDQLVTLVRKGQQVLLVAQDQPDQQVIRVRKERRALLVVLDQPDQPATLDRKVRQALLAVQVQRDRLVQVQLARPDQPAPKE